MIAVSGSKTLVVGLDGATFRVLDPLIARGLCPNLARLIETGARAPLNSTTPPMTLPSWSSFLTGCTPGVHGIYDFTHRVEGEYALEFTNSTHRAVPTVHSILSERGVRTACIAMPTTYPPEKNDGVMISGFDSPVATSIDGRFCHPRSLFQELEDRFGGMAFADFQELDIGEGWHEQALNSLLSEIERKEKIAIWLLEQERWGLFTLLFGESDTVSHHFWMFHDESSPRYLDDPELRTAIERVYLALDDSLGRILQAAGADVVMIASDHGFGPSGDYALYLNRYLEHKGWLTYKRDPYRGALGLATGSGWVDKVKELALEHLPAEMQQSLIRALPNSLVDRIESSSRYADIDFSKTAAFSDEMNYSATVHLNLHGRDRHGLEVDVPRLISDLLEWRADGEPVVSKVERREELYTGDCVSRSPDLIVTLNERGVGALSDGFSYTLLPSGRVPSGVTYRKLDTDELIGGKGRGMNGSHRQYGVLIINGRGVREGVEVDASMQDCAPTLLALMGEAIPDWCDGAVIMSALDGVSPRYTERGYEWFVRQEAGDGHQRDFSDDVEIRRRLKSLGYL